MGNAADVAANLLAPLFGQLSLAADIRACATQQTASSAQRRACGTALKTAFEIDDVSTVRRPRRFRGCCGAPGARTKICVLKALLLQKSAPNKYKQLISMQVNTRLEAELIVTSGSHQCCGAGASHSSDFV